MSPLLRLCEWFSGNCNEEWEHTYGISIETLDNPGWAVRIDLRELELLRKEFVPIKVDRNEANWIDCRVEQDAFVGFGGLRNLEEILTLFLDWACAQKTGAV